MGKLWWGQGSPGNDHGRQDRYRTQVIFVDQLRLPSPLEPAAAKVQVAKHLNKLNVNLQHIEPDQIVIEWRTE